MTAHKTSDRHAAASSESLTSPHHLSCHMSCEEAQPLLPLVADGALTADDDPVLFHHLAHCPHCQKELAIYDFIDLAIEQQTPAAPQQQRWEFGYAGAAVWLAAAASLLGLLLWHTWDEPTPDQPLVEQTPSVEIITVDRGPNGEQPARILIERDGQLMLLEGIDQGSSAGNQPNTGEAVQAVGSRW